MSIITLTTDLGVKDHYSSSLKGALLRQIPSATIIDISHEIAPYDCGQAAHVLGNAFHEFPIGTIHLVAVASGGSGMFNHVAIKFQDHYFVGCDNGVFSLLSPNNKLEQIIQIGLAGKEPSTFLARDLYLPAVIKLAQGIPIENLGIPQTKISELFRTISPPEIDVLKGVVVYIDQFNNIITNITGDDFDSIGKGRLFIIEVLSEEIKELHRTYGDVPIGGLVAFFNSAGVLELAMNNGKMATLFNLKLNSIIRIKFS